MGFTEFDAGFPQLSRARGNEQVLFIFFQFGTLVGRDGILQRQRMQPKLIAEAGDGQAVWRFELDPDETIRLADVVADIDKRNGLDLGVVEEQAVDDGTR
jgi:hypothetical protein